MICRQISDSIYVSTVTRNESMSDHNSAVAPFEFYERVEAAVRQFQKSGFDMRKLSIVARDYHSEEHVVGYYTTGGRMAYWGRLGAFWSGF
jgi:hypothetical protein